MAKKDDIEVQVRMKQKKWNYEKGGSGQLLFFKFTKRSSKIQKPVRRFVEDFKMNLYSKKSMFYT
jgi:hypothetical protein